MMIIHLFVPVLLILCIQCYGQTQIGLIVPPAVDNCIRQSESHPINPFDAKVDCIQNLLWHYKPNQNGTVEDRMYFSSISERTMRRQSPLTGYRTRKEYRTLTDTEKDDLHNAFNRLYENGTLRKYAELHARVVKKIQDGPAFLPWYRVFLAQLYIGLAILSSGLLVLVRACDETGGFEEELRQVSPRPVSLAYIDTSMDHELDNPVNSILWSSGHLGNGNGRVMTGAFRKWRTAAGYLQRNYASSLKGRLISKDDIRKIMGKCKNEEIVYPLENPSNHEENLNVLEYHFQGVLDWIGGDVSNPLTAAYDPAFYMNLAYIDYLWELFRRRQLNYCRVDPVWDYAMNSNKPGHSASDLMAGFDKYRNIDGLASFWTENWYNYADHPECQTCGGSKYLYCNTTLYRCVSHSRRTDFNVGEFKEHINSRQFGITSEPFEPVRDYVPKFNPQEYTIRGPLNDGRSVFTALKDARKAASNQRKSPIPTTRPNVLSRLPRIKWRKG